MVEHTVIVPANKRLDIHSYGDWPHHVYRLRKKSAGQWLWRKAWYYPEGQVYRPGGALAKSTEFYFAGPKNEGHVFFPEPKPFQLQFRVAGRFSSYIVVGFLSDERGLDFTDPTGKKVCGFSFTWDSTRNAYPSSVELWV